MNRYVHLARGAVAACALLFAVGVCAQEHEVSMANTQVQNIASLQRGARLFFNYCSGCHSLEYMRYSRIAEDLQLSDDEVSKNFIFTGVRVGDMAISNMPADKATKFFGKAPPDLSLEVRAKGADWVYDYLKSFYLDPTRPVGWNNEVFPNASMPNALWELQGVQKADFAPAKPGEDPQIEKLELVSPGTLSPTQFDDSVRDLTTFLEYVSEPAALKRESMGVFVLLYLVLFTFIAWLLKHEFWKDVE